MFDSDRARRPTNRRAPGRFPIRIGLESLSRSKRFPEGIEISPLASFSAGFPISMCEGTYRRPIVGLRVPEVVRIVVLGTGRTSFSELSL